MEVRDELRELLSGRDKIYGMYNVDPEGKSVKKSGHAQTFARGDKTWEELWDLHFEGKQGLGVIPIRDDNCCVWAAIDVDVYDLDLQELANQVHEAQLPLIVTRTKSGGAHLYIFFSEPCDCERVKDRMAEIASGIGHAGVEIFPKQKKIDPKTSGNWLNMPYFNEANGATRVGIKLDGSDMSLEEYVAEAKKLQISMKGFLGLDLPKRELPLPGIPPCLEALILRGFPEGTRNQGMFNLGVYAQKSNPDDWEPLMMVYNQDFMDPPLPMSEITTITRSLGKGEYQYTCQAPPVCNTCNRPECLKREFGVGGYNEDDGQGVEFGGMTKYVVIDKEGNTTEDEPYWSLDIDEIPVIFNTTQLTSQAAFRRRIADRLTKYPPPLPGRDFDRLIRDRMEHSQHVHLPFEMGEQGQFIDALRQFFTAMYSREKSDLTVGRVYDNGNGRIIFRAREAQQFINQLGFSLRQGKFYQLLYGMGVVEETVTVGTTLVKAWSIKKFDDFIDPDLVAKGVETEF